MALRNCLRIKSKLALVSEQYGISNNNTSGNFSAFSRFFSKTSALGLNGFQKKKILGEFSVLYDRNKDGFVDGKDIDNYRKCLFDYYALTRGENMKTYPTGYNDYWSLFRDVADENHDGKLSKEEWLNVWTSITEKAKNKSFKDLPQWVRLMPYVIFPIMDYKGDGLLDSDEYKRFWYEVGGIRASSAQVYDCINVMTQNGKHPLNMHRFQTLYADFYFSESEQSPGRYMGGPVEYT